MSINLTKREINPTKDFKMTEEQTAAAEESLQQAMQLQKELGLGNSEVAGNRLLSGCKAAKAIKILQKNFGFIEEPDTEKFPRFVGSETATSSKTFTAAPQYAMVRLSAVTKEIQCSGGGSTHKADMPVMPTTALALAKKVKEVTPNAEFHLIFEPEWKKQPQRDPVLVAKIAEGFWCQVADWGSDADAIKQMLQEKNLA